MSVEVFLLCATTYSKSASLIFDGCLEETNTKRITSERTFWKTVIALCAFSHLFTLSLDQQRCWGLFLQVQMSGWDNNKWSCKAYAVKVKSRSSVMSCFAATRLCRLVLLSAFLLLTDRSDAYLSRWWVIPTITKDGSKWKKQLPLTFQRYSSQVHCICVEKCYCMRSALFGKVHKFSVTQGLTALIEHI